MSAPKNVVSKRSFVNGTMEKSETEIRDFYTDSGETAGEAVFADGIVVPVFDKVEDDD